MLHNADAAGLPPFVQAKTFVAKFWQPPYFEILPTSSAAGNRKDEGLEQREGDGTSSGAAVVTDGQDSTLVPVTVAEVKEERYTPISELSTSASPNAREKTSRQGSTSGDTTMVPRYAPSSLARDLSVDAPGSKHAGSELGREVPDTKQKRLQDEQGIHWLGDKVR